MASTFSFPKSLRLSNRKSIDKLYSSGKNVKCYPLRFKVLVEPQQDSITSSNLLLVVPKRLFKHAVLRNRLKRKMKEAYRLNASLYEKESSVSKHLTLIAAHYIAKEELSYSEIEEAMRLGLKKISALRKTIAS